MTGRLKLPILPPMQCDEGCDLCCGAIPTTEGEFQRIRFFAAKKGIEPLRQGNQCPWFQAGRCAVWAVRPEVCQIFGHHEKLVCPRGYNTNVPAESIDRVMRTRKATRFLHEVLYECFADYELSEAEIPDHIRMGIKGASS